ADGRAISALQLEQEAFEIARHLDVHARAEALLNRGDRHAPRSQKAREDVVAVGTDHEPVDRQPHAACNVPGIDIAEIAGGYAERDRPRGRAERYAGGEIIHGLCGNSRPVDRIDRREMKLAPEPDIGKQGFDEILTIIERPR